MMALLSRLALLLLWWLLRIKPLRPGSLYALVDGHGEGCRSCVPPRNTSIVRNATVGRTRWQFERNRLVIKTIAWGVSKFWWCGKWTMVLSNRIGRVRPPYSLLFGALGLEQDFEGRVMSIILRQDCRLGRAGRFAVRGWRRWLFDRMNDDGLRPRPDERLTVGAGKRLRSGNLRETRSRQSGRSRRVERT